MVTTDSGAHRIVLSQLYECYQPRGLLQSSALCTMGCAVPSPSAASWRSRNARSSATVGDAGLEMFLGELATVSRPEARHPHRRLRRQAARPDRAEAAHLASFPVSQWNSEPPILPPSQKRSAARASGFATAKPLDGRSGRRSRGRPSRSSPPRSVRDPMTGEFDAHLDNRDPSLTGIRIFRCLCRRAVHHDLETR